jgi:signal transduction histidine kinase
MSLATATGFLMCGAALILATRVSRPWIGIAVRLLTFGAGAIGVLGLAAYAVSAPLLFPGYIVINVAVHTAAGLLLLAVGLHSSWSRLEWAQIQLITREDDRITFVGATILVVSALVAGIASFAVLQRRTQTLVSGNVLAELARRVETFSDLVQLRETNARIAATRPAALRNLRVVHAGRDDGSNIENIRAVVDGLLKQGFSGLTYLDVDGKVVASGGAFAQAPAMAVTLETAEKAELLWDGGFLLRHRIPLRDAQGPVGTVWVEQPLTVLTRFAREAPGLGATGEMGLCVRRDGENQCFPQRLSPKAFSTPELNPLGAPFPMSRALGGETGTVITEDYRARSVIAAYGPVGDLGLGMVVKVDTVEVFQPIREQLQLAAGLLLLLAVAGTLLLRSQVRPLATKLVEAEEILNKRTKELEISNKELEAFSYSVSHDLRAPLRHIDGFADMMREECEPVLNDSGRRLLDTISQSAKEMGKLIDALLMFSKMGRVGMHESEVSMDELVAEVRQELGREAERRTVEWRIEPLPAVRGDRAMLKQVWVNLLSNSLKYTGTRQTAQITIGCSRKSGQLEFHVQDNGVGFDMRYADKLFGVFQRLHRAEEFEGTGVGLANVRRIVGRHGGKTWADARIDAGATFYFTLPDSPRNRP